MPLEDEPLDIAALAALVSDEKLRRIGQVLDQRTRRVTLVLEDIHSSHNASACLRTCECLGIQDVHVIENRNTFDPSSDVLVGAAQWLSVTRYDRPGEDNTLVCLERLKQEGYRILAASPEGGQEPLARFDPQEKTALVFGAELAGLSETARERADGMISLPMYGMTESYNVSVAVALCLFPLVERLKSSSNDGI